MFQDAVDELKFTELLRHIYRRHANVVPVMAKVGGCWYPAQTQPRLCCVCMCVCLGSDWGGCGVSHQQGRKDSAPLGVRDGEGAGGSICQLQGDMCLAAALCLNVCGCLTLSPCVCCRELLS